MMNLMKTKENTRTPVQFSVNKLQCMGSMISIFVYLFVVFVAICLFFLPVYHNKDIIFCIGHVARIKLTY